MKSLYLSLMCLVLSGNIYGSTAFTCITKSNTGGYYIKKVMALKILGHGQIFVKPYDSDTKTWNDGSRGKFVQLNPQTEWAHFSGFDSDGMFGDLSEGQADRGISVYLSPEIIKGQSGAASLFASGTTVGVEKGGYYCRATN